MLEYFGTKRIKARPMSWAIYHTYRGWKDGVSSDDPGYLVEYLDNSGPSNHKDHAGYISWSPKDVFEGHYQPTTAMSFGHAIVALKAGHRVGRVGWNGKGMWLSLVKPGFYDVAIGAFGLDCTVRRVELLPWIGMKTADNKFVPWLASQTDMLADDWSIVE